MADFENQLLQQQDKGLVSGKDERECARKQDSGDESQSEGESDLELNSTSNCPPRALQHNGPQTGVKGVIADYNYSISEQRRRREEQQAVLKADYAAVAQHNIKNTETKTIWTKDENSGSDSDLDVLDQADELVFADYKQERLAALSKRTVATGFSGNPLGVLLDVPSEEYVDIVDQLAEPGTPVLVILVDNSCASERLTTFIGAQAANYSHSAFLCVQAKECGFTDPTIIPIVLVYRHGELEHNLVRVVDRFSDPLNFESRDVNRLLDTILQK
ncbi:hypothetical protein GGI25_000505 [Coemansia spiralis]|uniref:Phosducin domain-containing protein n=2 Tax=Coemansia TaxID=4863 RepID=A0A9W8GCF0_9FUNG|nr:hypothetical protein BX070DRAFT_236771 [Coemansia spiralis]KAJ1995964.1 hypothetical protein EDC05_000332 [Coemansia umbellata]KAJ2625409.1 hypothetical protein GGI26_000549 [Coemansia sp. RSA 1358]KAJ2680532.1 hypothetical protein GGI25_000505 [Coemansia spiralis]